MSRASQRILLTVILITLNVPTASSAAADPVDRCGEGCAPEDDDGLLPTWVVRVSASSKADRRAPWQIRNEHPRIAVLQPEETCGQKAGRLDPPARAL